MKAVILTNYGGPEVLHLQEIEKPSPLANEIRVKIKAASVNYGDLIVRDFKHLKPREFNMPFVFWLMARFYFGLNKPRIKILGSEFSGEVDALGQAVKGFRVGDEVFGYRGEQMGAYAEYLCLPADGVVTLKPGNMSFAEAAAIPSGGMTALNILRRMNIRPGQKVLINGASGGIGSVAVQLAKQYGAEVTGVCGTPRLEFVKSLGAKRVIDYTQTDFSEGSERYNLVFDVLGRSSFARCKKVLTADGRYVRVSFKVNQLLQMGWTHVFGSQKVICALSPQVKEDLADLRELVEAGQVKSIIDRSFPLEQAAAAHRYVADGHKKGHVVIAAAA